MAAKAPGAVPPGNTRPSDGIQSRRTSRLCSVPASRHLAVADASRRSSKSVTGQRPMPCHHRSCTRRNTVMAEVHPQTGRKDGASRTINLSHPLRAISACRPFVDLSPRAPIALIVLPRTRKLGSIGVSTNSSSIRQLAACQGLSRSAIQRRSRTVPWVHT